MLRRAVLTFAICALCAMPAHAEQSFEADVKATPASVHQVITGGFWTHGKDEGHYRIVIVAGGFEHVSHRLFIQWIAIDQDNHDLKVVRTVAVTEISELSGVISDVRLQLKPKGPFRFALTLHGRDNVRRTRVVTATPDGRYTIK
jgi:hypothetical protein